tara:strand:- start:1137 stop:1871 length:735 start_codon:yes stop_codon:yes gene_type:complete
MKHFIITRFNDYFPCPMGATVNPHLGIEEEWLRTRINLLQEITIPSIEVQTDKDFTWILKCHPQTPSWARKFLDSENFIVSYAEEQHKYINWQAARSFSKIIRKITEDKCIITTRLDSDDAFSKDHIKLVKGNIQPDKFFDIRRGIVKIKNNYFLHHKNGTSQFCSFMENSKQIKTVYYKTHPEIKEAECIQDQINLGWVQNHHPSNITAHLKEGRVYPSQATMKDWPLLETNFPSLFKRRLFL